MTLEAPYGSTQQADTAYWNWVGNGGQDGQDGGAPSSSLSGSLSVPDTVTQASAFTATGAVENTTDTQVTGRVVLGVRTPESSQPFAQLSRPADLSLGAGESTDLDFQAVRGALQVSPGDHEFVLFVAAEQPQGATGVVATASAAVSAGGQQGTEWGEPTHVRELPMGWHLYKQTKGSGEDQQTRYFVSGKDSNGEIIYLTKDGSVAREPGSDTYYADLAAVRQALQAYADRLQNGDVNERNRPQGDRPTTDALRRDIAKAREQARRRRKQLLLAGTVAVVAAGGYVYYKKQQGELREVPLIGDWLADSGGSA